MGLAGCGPGPETGGKLPAPFDLRAETTSHGSTIFWSIDRRKADPIFGYDIYLSQKPLKDKFKKWNKNRPAPYNPAPYPGDTDGDRTKESFEFKNLENGREYFVSVRTVGTGGIESKPSNEISFTPMAKGVFVISSDHSTENGGFGFDSETSMPARDLRCDIYLYVKGDEFGLSSPSRLGAGLHRTNFIKTGQLGGLNHDTIKIKKGDRVTASGKGGMAMLEIIRIVSVGSKAEATIRYEFYPAGTHPK